MKSPIVLVTGGSGFIASSVATALSGTHQLVRMSRSECPGPGAFVRGSFASAADVAKLAGDPIDVVVHLAASDGSLPDHEVLEVNLLGTHTLLKHMLELGCRKFVMASSIAAVGCLNPSFRPAQIPIPDDHPCFATDAYGLSKAMGEELSRYFHRTFTDADFISLRIGVVHRIPLKPSDFARPSTIPFCELAGVMLADVVDAICCCVDAPPKPGVRVMNLVGPSITSIAPTRKALDQAGVKPGSVRLGPEVLSDGSRHALYAMNMIASEVGFVPRRETQDIV